MQIGPFGLPELLVIMAIALVIFGPRRLPELSRSLGRALAEFRKGSDDLRRSLEREIHQVDREVRIDDEAPRVERPAGSVSVTDEEIEESSEPSPPPSDPEDESPGRDG